MRLKVLKRGKTLFFAGDFPDNFYIILRGSVFVLIPKDLDSMKLEKTDESDKISHFLEKAEKAEKVKKSEFSPFLKNRRISINLLKKSSSILSNSSDLSTNLKGSMSHYYNKDLSVDFEFQDFEKPWLFFENGVFKYNCINILSSGQNFGELGLLIKKPRNATILCKEDSFLLFLEKKDYMMLQEIDRHKIMRKWAFFSQYFFRDFVHNDYVLRMIYNFQKKKYIFGQKIYEENAQIDGCFLIKKGVILLRKKIVKNRETSENNPKNMRIFKKSEKIEEIEVFYKRNNDFYLRGIDRELRKRPFCGGG